MHAFKTTREFVTLYLNANAPTADTVVGFMDPSIITATSGCSAELGNIGSIGGQFNNNGHFKRRHSLTDHPVNNTDENVKTRTKAPITVWFSCQTKSETLFHLNVPVYKIKKGNVRWVDGERRKIKNRE